MICSSLHRHLYPLLLGIGLLATSCQQGEQRSTRLQIATTIAPAAQVITEIADSLVAVTTLLPQGNNPENYEPTPQAIQALTSSAAYFYMGDLGFERSWVGRIHTMQPALQLVRLDQDLVGPSHLHNGTPTDLHDPHYWTSVRGLQSMGKSIYSSLCRIDTMHRAQYDAGYQRFTQRLEHVDRTIKEQLSDIPSRAFVIYHRPSLSLQRSMVLSSSSSSKMARSLLLNIYKHSSKRLGGWGYAWSSSSRNLTPSSSRASRKSSVSVWSSSTRWEETGRSNFYSSLVH